MQPRHQSLEPAPAAAPVDLDISFGANAVRLSLREWAVAALAAVAILVAAPILWQACEKFQPGPDYRVPFRLSRDTWIFERLVEDAACRGDIPVLGDSVIWGEYVTPGQALSARLTAKVSGVRFANCGLNGMHPLALEGLIRYHARSARDTRVVVHLNLLWMSSRERDLSAGEQAEGPFNHPRLVPQFFPWVPAYHASTSERISIVLGRGLPFRQWVQHLRADAFEGLDVATWSVEHPCENPLARLRLEIPQPEALSRHGKSPLPWNRQGIEPQDMPWVPLDDSLQWRAFLRLLTLLRERNNRVCVIIGPFNEHLLAPPSRKRYRSLLEDAARRLRQQGLAVVEPSLLPSSQYGDASHPLAAGYQRLAGEISASRDFERWVTGL